MLRATARTNIKILALPPNAAEMEKRSKKEKKKAERKGKEIVNNNKEKKTTPVYNGTYTKNIIYKEVLTA